MKTLNISSSITNSSNNQQEVAISSSLSHDTRVGLQTAYSLIFVLGVLGNFAVIKVLGKRSHLRSSGNILLMNMVVTELAVVLTNIPFDILLIEVNQSWIFGSAMCKILWPVQTMCFGAFVWTLALLSYHRYRGVCSLNKRLSSTTMKYLILLVWTGNAVTVIPFGVFLEYNNHECQETWGIYASKVFTLALFLSQYVIPLGVNTFCYCSIGIAVRRGHLRVRKHIRGSFEAESKRSRRTVRAIRTAVVFVSIFAVCMLPHQVLWMWMVFGQDTANIPPTFIGLAYIFTFTSSFLNPLVYIFSTPSVRKELLRKTIALRNSFFLRQRGNHFNYAPNKVVNNKKLSLDGSGTASETVV